MRSRRDRQQAAMVIRNRSSSPSVHRPAAFTPCKCSLLRCRRALAPLSLSWSILIRNIAARCRRSSPPAPKCRSPQVGTRERLEADHVYVIPPNRRLQVIDHEISALEFDGNRVGKTLSHQSFLRSLGGTAPRRRLRGHSERGRIGRRHRRARRQGSRRDRSRAGSGRGGIFLDAAQRDRDRDRRFRSAGARPRWAAGRSYSASRKILCRRPTFAILMRTNCGGSSPICACAPVTISRNTSASTVVRRIARRMQVTRGRRPERVLRRDARQCRRSARRCSAIC